MQTTRLRNSMVYIKSDRQADGQTDGRTDRQTDRLDWKHYLPAYAGCNKFFCKRWGLNVHDFPTTEHAFIGPRNLPEIWVQNAKSNH